MKKNFIAKITLGVLLCASLVPAAAGTHYRTLKLNNTNAVLQPHQQVTDMGYRAKNHSDANVSISLRETQNTSKVDMRVLDVNKNVILDWKTNEKFAGWNEIGLNPVAGTTIGEGSPIDIQLRDHYDHRLTSYVVDGELDYN